MDPTPRPDRISKDYKKEYPSIEVEGRRTIKKKADTKKNIENVRLDGEVGVCSGGVGGGGDLLHMPQCVCVCVCVMCL